MLKHRWITVKKIIIAFTRNFWELNPSTCIIIIIIRGMKSFKDSTNEWVLIIIIARINEIWCFHVPWVQWEVYRNISRISSIGARLHVLRKKYGYLKLMHYLNVTLSFYCRKAKLISVIIEPQTYKVVLNNYNAFYPAFFYQLCLAPTTYLTLFLPYFC